MAFAIGDLVLPTRANAPTGPLFKFGRSRWSTGIISAAAAGSNTVIFGPGFGSIWLDDEIDLLTFTGASETVSRLVRPVGNTSPEFTGMAVGEYGRLQGSTVPVGDGKFVMVAMLNGKGYYEVPVSELESIVGSR